MIDSKHIVGYYKNNMERWTIGVFKKKQLSSKLFYWFGWIDPCTGKVNSPMNNDRWLSRLEHVKKIKPDVLMKVWVEPSKVEMPKLPEPPKVEMPKLPEPPKVEPPKVEMPELKNPEELSEPLKFGINHTEVSTAELPKLDLDPRPGILGVPTIMVYRMVGRVTVNSHLDTVVGLYDVSICDHRVTGATYVSGNSRITPEAFTQVGYPL